MKTPSETSATQLRRSRRQARYHGLRPTIATSCSSAARSEALSSVRSVAGSAIPPGGECRSVRAPGGALTAYSLVLFAYFLQRRAKSIP